MRLTHPNYASWLLTGLSGLLLAPVGLAQLGDMEAILGSLGHSQLPRLGDVTGDGLVDLLFFTEGDAPKELGLIRAEATGSYGYSEIVIPGPSTPFRNTFQLDDIDGDGDLDIWVIDATFGGGTLVGYLNDGTGEFSAGPTYPVPSGAGGIRRRDIDGDGFLDLFLFVSSGGNGFLRALPGSALQGFEPLFSAGPEIQTPLLLDSDGDGDLDVLSLRAADPAGGGSRIALFHNEGTFPLDPTTGIVVEETIGTRGFAGDYDGDGDTDAVIYRGSMTQSNLFENEGGVLVPRDFMTQASVFKMVDVDGDDDEDLLYVVGPGPGYPSNHLFYRENQLSQGFGPPQDYGFESWLPDTEADVNQDGLNDFLFFSSFSGVTEVYLRYGELQGGAPILGEEWLRITDTSGRNPPVVFDPNGDGLDDLLVAIDERLAWRRALGGGKYATSQDIQLLEDDNPEMTTGDFNGDGHEDIAYMSRSVDLAVLAGDGTGAFPAAPSVTTSIVPWGVEWLYAADMNQDGLDDLLITRNSTTAIAVVLQDAGGGWEPFEFIPGFAGTSVVPVPIDANGDGLLDLVFCNDEVIEISLQAHSGTFSARSVVVDASAFFPNGGSLEPLAVADIDEDGVSDLAVPLGDNVMWSKGLGAGNFGPLQGLLANAGPSGLADLHFIRVDSDERLDLVVSRPSSSQARQPVWSPSLGPATFGALQEVSGSVVTGSLSLRSMAPADVDGDGDMDLVSFTFADSHVVTQNLANGELGTSYCGPAVPNSTGNSGAIAAFGSTNLGANELLLRAGDLPPNKFGFFVNSLSQGVVTTVPNSIGTLCLSGAIGRFNQAGEILLSGPAGTFSLPVDLTSIPTPSGDVGVFPGETWNFQAWFRDSDGMGGTTSNFTDGIEVGY